MQGLSPTQKRVLTPACPPGPIRLVVLTLVSGLVVVLLDRGLLIPDVLTLLGAVAMFTLVMTGSTAGTGAAMLARACVPAAQHVLARAAAAS